MDNDLILLVDLRNPFQQLLLRHPLRSFDLLKSNSYDVIEIGKYDDDRPGLNPNKLTQTKYHRALSGFYESNTPECNNHEKCDDQGVKERGTVGTHRNFSDTLTGK
jgi:hypothetical protein